MQLPTLILAALAGMSLAGTSPLFSRKDFTCPPTMDYSPWLKACSCPPGQSYDSKQKSCKGPRVEGPWPKPSVDKFSISSDRLATFCAKTPTKIVEYDEGHKYCQAGVDTLTFSGSHDVLDELKDLDGDEIDVEKGDISGGLKNICAGLSGLYLEDVNDAVELFNTNEFGLDTLLKDVLGNLPGGIIDVVKDITCLIGLGKDCKHDCVSYCTEGCGNFLNGLLGNVGGLLEELNGLCILDGVLEFVEGVTCGIDDLLCVVGNVVEQVLGLFDCDCNDDGDDGDDDDDEDDYDEDDDHCKEKCKRSTPDYDCPPECKEKDKGGK